MKNVTIRFLAALLAVCLLLTAAPLTDLPGISTRLRAAGAQTDGEAAFTPEDAIDIYWENMAVWAVPYDLSPYNGYYYTFIDLDCDGVLELVSHINKGLSVPTATYYYRIDPRDRSVQPIELQQAESEIDYCFDFSENSVRLLRHRVDGYMTYYCTSHPESKDGQYTEQFGALTMRGSALSSRLLFEIVYQMSILGERPSYFYTYTDGKRNGQITGDEYEAAEEAFLGQFEDMELSWRNVYEYEYRERTPEQKKALLLQAYKSFRYNGFSFSEIFARNDRIQYGSYPQSLVTDEKLISRLDAEPKPWVSYGYYTGTGNMGDGNMAPSDFMKYADFSYESVKYRAVTFSAYRPSRTGSLMGSDLGYQKKNGYLVNEVYYFIYEPITWRVIDPDEGLVISELVLDSQPYQNSIYYGNDTYQDASCSAYASDYAASSIREWLNRDFYNTVFSDAQKLNIRDDILLNNDCPENAEYSSAPTKDKVFLLSYEEATDGTFFFYPEGYDDTKRRASGTDYAKCQGLDSLTYKGEKRTWWWLRSPHYAVSAYVAHPSGRTGKEGCLNVSSTEIGVRPACRLYTLVSEDIRTIAGTFSSYESESSPAGGESQIREITIDEKAYPIDPALLTKETADTYLRKRVAATLKDGVVIKLKVFEPPVFYEKSYIADIWLNLRYDIETTPESEELKKILGYEPLSKTIAEACESNRDFMWNTRLWDGMKILFDPTEIMSQDTAKTRIYESLILDLLQKIADDTLNTNRTQMQNILDTMNIYAEKITKYNEFFQNLYTLFGNDEGSLLNVIEAIKNPTKKEHGELKKYLNNILTGKNESSSENTFSEVMDGLDRIAFFADTLNDFCQRTVAYAMVVNMSDEMAAVLRELRAVAEDKNFQKALDEVISAIGNTDIATLVCVKNLSTDLLTNVTSEFLDGITDFIPIYGVLKKVYGAGVSFNNLFLGTQGAVDAWYLAKATRDFTLANQTVIENFAEKYRSTRTEANAAAYVYAMQIYQYVYALDLQSACTFTEKATTSGLLKKCAYLKPEENHCILYYLFHPNTNSTYEKLCENADTIRQSMANKFDGLLTSWKYHQNYLRSDYPVLFSVFVEKDLSQEYMRPELMKPYLNEAGETCLEVTFPYSYYNEASGLHHMTCTSDLLTGVHVFENADGQLTEKDFPYDQAPEIRMLTKETFSYFPKEYTVAGYVETINGNEYTPGAIQKLESPCRPVQLSIRKAGDVAALYLSELTLFSYSNIDYHIYRKSADTEYEEIDVIQRSPGITSYGTFYFDKTGDPDTEYTYRVKSELTFTSGVSLPPVWSEEISVNGKTIPILDHLLKLKYIAPSETPTAKKGLMKAPAKEVQKAGILLEWNTDAAFAGFEIYRKADYGTEYELIAVTDGDAVSYLDEALESNVSYEYMLLPFGKNGAVRIYYPAAICSGHLNPPGSVDFIRGDVNGDGKITEEDAGMALRIAVGNEPCTPDSAAFLAADVNENGFVTSEDVNRIVFAVKGWLSAEDLPGDLPGDYNLVYTYDTEPVENDGSFIGATGSITASNELKITVTTFGCTPMIGFMAELLYDPELFTFLRAEESSDAVGVREINDGPLFAEVRAEDGRIQLGFSYANGIKNTQFQSPLRSIFECVDLYFAPRVPVAGNLLSYWDYGRLFFTVKPQETDMVQVSYDPAAHCHKWKSVSFSTACEEPGAHMLECTLCGEKASVPVTETGHTWDAGTVTRQATAVQEGEKTYTCAVCGKVKTEPIDKLPAVTPVYMPGDVDQNGKITAADARLALRKAVGLEKYAPGSAQFSACDVNGDGRVTAADARSILRAAVGLDTLDRTPGTKEEIVSFYKNAVNKVRYYGAAGFVKKEWQTLGDLQLTGIGATDTAIQKVAESFFTKEADAVAETYTKGSEAAGNAMAGWKLTDLSKVKSAKLARQGGNYSITIVMADEDTPHRGGGGHLEQVGCVPMWEDINAELQKIDLLKQYEDVHILYRNYTISAVISPDGRILSLKHHCDIDVSVGSAKILIVTLTNKSFHMENTVVFSDFKY